MVAAMAAAGHEVAAAVWPGDVIHAALAPDPRVRLYPACFRVRNDLGATRDVMRIAREFQPDWIVGTFKREYWPLAAASKLLRTPIVLFSHLDQRMQPLMVRGLPRLVHRIIAPSEYQRARLIARGMPAARVVVLHNSFDTKHFHVDPGTRAAARAALGFGPDDVVVGFAGRLELGKGVCTLAESLGAVMESNRNVRGLWVGHGESEDEVRAITDRLGKGGRHVWRPWSADVVPFYAAMDILALPSIGPETFGRVLVEAQACGVPVLGSRNGGISEAMEDGVTGWLLPPGDVAAWTAALRRLCDDAPLRQRMGGACRAFAVARFDAAPIAAAFTAMLTNGA
jgi:glycosyltransferase involved in cell wall biosynthesis